MKHKPTIVSSEDCYSAATPDEKQRLDELREIINHSFWIGPAYREALALERQIADRYIETSGDLEIPKGSPVPPPGAPKELPPLRTKKASKWDNADWTKSNKELAAEFKVTTPQTRR